MDPLILDDRKQSILLNVVEDYIKFAEPVGSRSLSKSYVEKLSPATIRNVMSDLEDMGFLRQPHPSAGRVPTDMGYRFFVDQLLRPPNFLDEVESFANQDNDGKNLQEVLENACINLSKNTKHTGLVMIPSFSNMLFKHIEFIKVGQSEALAIFFSELGVLQNKVIPIEKNITQDDLISISRYLNDEFSGKSIKHIRQELLHALKHEKDHYNELMQKALEFSSKIFTEENENDADTLLVEGALNLFDHPEFKVDLEKIKLLLKTLEEKTKLVKLLDLCLQHDGMTIFIGEENQAEEMESCSLIAQNYQMGNEKMGTIAIVGPKRMDYKSAISLVNHTAKSVSKMISEQNRS
jgi:heat-inducible transcriptional repressor